MKTFRVYLRDGRTAEVQAEAYRHEGNQYLFGRADSGETQFFVDSEVVGISETDSPKAPEASPVDESNLPFLAKVEEEAILQTLTECGGNRTHTAKKLGISRRALIYKLKRLRKGILPS